MCFRTLKQVLITRLVLFDTTADPEDAICIAKHTEIEQPFVRPDGKFQFFLVTLLIFRRLKTAFALREVEAVRNNDRVECSTGNSPSVTVSDCPRQSVLEILFLLRESKDGHLLERLSVAKFLEQSDRSNHPAGVFLIDADPFRPCKLVKRRSESSALEIIRQQNFFYEQIVDTHGLALTVELAC